MPVVAMSKKYLLKLVSPGMGDTELGEQISKMGCNLERVSGDELSIEVSPNRPDLFGAVGFARSLKNFMHRSKKLVYQAEDDTPAYSVNVGKEVAGIRPYIASFAAMGLKLSEQSLTDVINFTEKFCDTYGRARRKIAIGLHDFDQVEMPLHYNAYLDEKYVPLNDTKERSFSEVLKATEKGTKYAYTIGKSGRYPALKDNHGVLSLIPILNSERTRVTAKTRNVLVDMTGMSEEPVNKAADLLAAMFMDLGATIRKAEIAYPGRSSVTPALATRYVSMSLSHAEAEIGVKVGSGNIISLANKMGYEAALVGNEVRFRVPEYRMDIINEQDIVEDIAIAYGYDYIQPVAVPAVHAGSLEAREGTFDNVSEALVGMGYSEMANTYLTNEETDFTDMRIKGPEAWHGAEGSIKLNNAKAQSLTMMRTWLLPSLLKNVGMSTHEKMPQRVFELDMAFGMQKKKPAELYHLACVNADPKSNFNNIKAVAESILFVLGIENAEIDASGHESFIPGRCARVSKNGKLLGFFGELHPEVLNNFGIEEPTSALELDLTALDSVAKPGRK